MRQQGVRFHLALDSGAFSIFHKHVFIVKEGVGAANVSVRAEMRNRYDTSFLESKEFEDYLENYVAYVRKNSKHLDFCVGLDILFDPKRTYELWDELDKQGVKTLPVVHFGEDPAWLRKYMDRCEYLGIGGLGKGGANKYTYHKWARGVFKLLTDKHGKPKWKTHGFAMSSVDLMLTYPWTSVDSSSPFYHSRMGNLCVPRYTQAGKEDAGYLRDPGVVSVTERRTLDRNSYLNTKRSWRQKVDAHIERLGFTFEEVSTSYTHRDVANVMLYNRAAQLISKQREHLCPPLKLYVSGKPGAGEDEFMAALPLLSRHGVHDFHYLGTYFLPKPTDYFISKGLYKGQSIENGQAAVRAKARPTLRR